MFINDIFSKKQLNEGLRSGEYYLYRVYFDDGTSVNLEVTSDEFDFKSYYAKKGKNVVRVERQGGIRSDFEESRVGDTDHMNKQHQEFYAKNPNFKRSDRELVHVDHNRMASKVAPKDGVPKVAKKPVTQFESEVDEAYDTSENNREYFDNVQDWAQAVQDFGADVIKAQGVYVAHGWYGEAGEFDPATGEGWLVSKVMREGVAEGSDNLSYIGNCTDDDVIEHIFGDATNFAQAVEEHGDEFTIDDLVVKYDPKTDVHSFYYKKQGVAEGLPGSLSKSDYTSGKTVKHDSTNCTVCHGRKVMYKLDGKLHADNKPGATKVKCPTCKGTGDKQGVSEADKHSFVGKIQRGHELKKKVDQTWKDIGDAQRAGDTKGANRAFSKHVRYTNLERPGTWRDVKDEGIAEAHRPVPQRPEEPSMLEKIARMEVLGYEPEQMAHRLGVSTGEIIAQLRYLHSDPDAGLETFDDIDAMYEDASVSKAEANYTDHAKSSDKCLKCAHFIESGACRIVEGHISPDGWCKFFKAEGIGELSTKIQPAEKQEKFRYVVNCDGHDKGHFIDKIDAILTAQYMIYHGTTNYEHIEVQDLLRKEVIWRWDAKHGEDESNAVYEGLQGIDSVELDIPLLIRLLEYAREDAKSDMDLHNVTEKLVMLSQQGGALSMDDYDTIVGKISEAFKMPKQTAAEKLYAHHQKIRQKSGLPHPDYYKELHATYDLPDEERYAKAAELKKKYGLAEAGPFSYGAKKPRKGSVADLAAQKRKEQERGKKPIEPRDQMVGTAKVTNEDVDQYLEELQRAGYELVNEERMSCPECGGPAYSDRVLAEKQDACYHKVKSRYKVWPSAYASGALVRCRKVGAKNWGNKSKK